MIIESQKQNAVNNNQRVRTNSRRNGDKVSENWIGEMGVQIV